MSQLSYSHIYCQSSFKLEIPEELSGRTIQNRHFFFNHHFCKVDKGVEYSGFLRVKLHNQIPDCPLLIPPGPCSDTASRWMSIWDQLPSPSWSLGKYTAGTPVHPRSSAFNPSHLCPQGTVRIKGALGPSPPCSSLKDFLKVVWGPPASESPGALIKNAYH